MKRGFTLIELLAVIILLGLIAAITIPIITNIIEVADNKGLIESAENYIEAVEYSLKTINIDKDFNPTTCVVQKTGNILCDGVSVEVEVNKNIPTSGVIKLKNGVMQSVVDLNIDGVLLSTDSNKVFFVKTDIKVDTETNPDNDDDLIVDNQDSELVVYYDYQSGSNTELFLKDLSGNNNDGTFDTAYLSEKGVYFDGNSAVLIDEINYPNITYNVSFMLTSYSDEKQMIISNIQDGGCAIFIDESNRLGGRCYLGNEYVDITSSVIDTYKLYSVTLTYDGSNLNLYLNDNLEQTYNSTAKFSDPTDSTVLALGTNPYQNTKNEQYFYGYIYSARVYKTAISKSEVDNNYEIDLEKYNSLNTAYETEELILKYEYDSEENTETTLKDLSGNNNDGTLVGTKITSNGIIFDGKEATDYVSIKELNYPSLSYTVAFKLNNDNMQSIIANFESGGCGIKYDDSNSKLYSTCYMGSSYKSLYSQNTIEQNKVYVATLTYNGYYYRFYLDGVLQDEYTYGNGITQPIDSTVVMLGSNPLGNIGKDEYFGGAIYAANIYKRALNDSEISYMHKNMLDKYSGLTKIDDSYGLIVSYDMTSDLNTESYVYDLSGNGNNGSIANNAVYSSEGLTFDGTNQAVLIKAITMDNMTLDIEFKTEKTTGELQSLIANYQSGGCGIYIDTNNYLVGECHIGGKYIDLISKSAINLNQKYRATITYDGNYFKFYVDEVLQDEYGSTSGIKNVTTYLALAGNPNGSICNMDYFAGTIYKAKYYNRAITFE